MIGPLIQFILIVICILIAYDFVQQSALVYRFLRYLHIQRKLNETPTVTRYPKSAVILSLRGPDPRLKDTLHALMRQDYPEFEVRIVVDNEEDPVLKDVLDVRDSSDSDCISVSVLRNVSPTCSLKCASLIQAVEDLDADTEIVAFIDGDAVPHPTWLRELVTPVALGEADVAGGNRWYLPPATTLGAMCRYFWNVPFFTGMWDQGAPWAGTMAFHRDTATRIGLLQAWSTAMSVDATLHRCMREHGLRFKLVESLIMPNREDISLASFHRWVARQMTVIRYSVSASVRTAQIQIGILGISHTVLPVSSILALFVGEVSLGLAGFGLLIVYWVTCCLRALIIEQSVRLSLQRRGEATGWIRPLTILMWCPSLAATHYIVGFGVVLAMRLKQVDWRGIRYRLSGKGIVRMTEYRPYKAEWISTENQSVV